MQHKIFEETWTGAQAGAGVELPYDESFSKH
jgi:hypothetical protein